MLCREDVVAHVLLEALAPAWPHSGLSCEVEDQIGLVDQTLQITASQIDRHELELLVFPCPLQVLELLRAVVVVVEAIDSQHRVPVAQQGFGQMGADESGAAGYEGAHGGTVQHMPTVREVVPGVNGTCSAIVERRVCGIAGKVSVERPVEARVVEAMRDTMVHRGPDSAGLHEGPGVALGIRRLRVIDLETGDQPIYNEDGNVAV